MSFSGAHTLPITQKNAIQILQDRAKDEQSSCVQWRGRKITYCISSALVLAGSLGCGIAFFPLLKAFFQVEQLPGWAFALYGFAIGGVSCVGGLYLCCCKSDDNTEELIEALDEYQKLSNDNKKLLFDLEEVRSTSEQLRDKATELEDNSLRIQKKVVQLAEKNKSLREQSQGTSIQQSSEQSKPVQREEGVSWWLYLR